MAVPGHQAALSYTGSASEQLIPVLSRRLAAAGMGVEVCRHRDACELTILDAASGKSVVALEASGQARWYYEPAAGPGSAPAALTEIIAYLLGAPGHLTGPTGLSPRTSLVVPPD